MIRSASCRLNRALGLGAALLALYPPPAAAIDLGENAQMHGFVSQGVVHTSDNRVGGGSDDGLAADMRELGLNLSWRPNSDWMLSAQALARWAGAADEGEPRLDYGFVDRSLFSSDSSHVGLRLGKVKNPLGFYNTTRDVAHTRPGATMPQSIYLDRVRNFYLAAPGASLYGLHTLDRWEANWSLNFVRPEADDVDLEYLLLLNNWSGHIQGRPSWLGQLMLDRDGGRWRFGLTVGNINMRYKPAGVLDPIQAGEHNLDTWVLSAQRNAEKWSLTAEYSQTDNKVGDYGFAFPVFAIRNSTNTVESWYVQGLWRPAQDWSVYLRRDEIYLNNKDKDGISYGLLFPGQGHATYGKSWTLGARRDLGAWSFWAEWARVDGGLWLSPQEMPNPKKEWDMLMLQAAWRF